MKRCLVVIPVYNESVALPRLINLLNELESEDPRKSIEFLFINDGSEDGSEEILLKSGLNYVSLANNLGIGAAVQCGYMFAERNGYDYLVQLDGDGQHPPGELEKLLVAAEESEEDLIIGSRFISNSGYRPGIFRKLGMIYSTWIVRRVTGETIRDTTSGFRLTKKRLIRFFASEYPHREAGVLSLLMAAKAGFRFREIPIRMNKRRTGKSSIRIDRALFYPFKTIINTLAAILGK